MTSPADRTHGDPDPGPRVPGCHEDTSHLLADAPWVEPDPDRDADRPRYRALAAPWYAADPVSGAPQLVGWRLTVYRVDAYWLAAAGERGHAPLGFTSVPATVAGALDPAAARAQVADYLRLLADPLPTRVTPSDVALYREVRSP